MILKEVIGSASWPVGLEQAKEHLNITHDEKDDYISDLIAVATKFVENEFGASYHTATYDLYYDEFPVGDISIPRQPLTSVTYVKYYDVDNVQQTLVENTDYRVDLISGTVEAIEPWPETYNRKSAVRIQFTSGAESENDIDPLVIHSIKFKIGILYANREAPNSDDETALQNAMNKLKSPSF